MNGKQVLKLLQQKGWVTKRVRGSHHMMTDGKKSVPIPVHASRDIPIGTLKAIEKSTGVKLT